MDKTQFYNLLNIENTEEFTYYENVAALFEEEKMIESNLIFDLLKDIDFEFLFDSCKTYFEDFLQNIPDFESEFYILVDSIKMQMLGRLQNKGSDDDLRTLADEICKFRKWYSLDKLVFDKIANEEISVRDARYNFLAAKLLGEEYSCDFRLALDYDLEGYDVNLEVVFDDSNY